MLLRLLKSFRRRMDGPAREPAPDINDRNDHRQTPVAVLQRREHAQARAPVERHIEIAYGGLELAGRPLLDLVREAIADSGVVLAPRKLLHRPLSSLFLAQYYVYSLGVEGERAECGVFSGTSALIACRAARSRDPSYTGADLHLIDSFEGLGDPTEEDRFEGNEKVAAWPFARGAYAAHIDLARKALQDFPAVSFHKGWIPQVFDGLPDRRWAFLHLDVDHYAPTLAALEYFYPRLSPGGVVICDDYDSPTFPGAQRAWHRYCDDHAVPFVVLDTGQSVILKA